MTKKKVPTTEAAPAVKKTAAPAAPAAKKVAPAVKKAPAAKKAAAPAAKKVAKAATPKYKKGEVLTFKKRNGETGTGKFVETANYGKGDWVVMKVEAGRNPLAKVRPTEILSRAA